ncbi:chromate transporter [Massilia pinisoli]|uniref:Chromate transporter n=1 Tax=Massilia pinisoli TaxID=1772194 RepID=A0ABT1ZKY1_9BURK|nr:chromate transporter [Massilia pinisoli]MCS0580568.1 chromate transporter [Massilia pinisoli]
MTMPIHLTLDWADWLNLFGHFLTLSLMSVGGAISTTSEMHRFLVEQHHWLTQEQFNQSIALAQAAPGPNVLFVALMGWHVGMNAGSTAAALFGVLVTMVGIMTPSTVITYTVAGWGHRNRDLRAVRAFKQGMAPIVIALLLSTAWIMASSAAAVAPPLGAGIAAGTPVADAPAAAGPGADALRALLAQWPLRLTVIVSCLVIWRTRIHLLWLLAAGAVLGALGLI